MTKVIFVQFLTPMNNQGKVFYNAKENFVSIASLVNWYGCVDVFCINWFIDKLKPCEYSLCEIIFLLGVSD